MNDVLHVAAIQYDIHWESPVKNLEVVDRLLVQLPNTIDLIVLPEMFATGFSMNAASLAQSMDGEIIAWMLNKARVLDAVICGSVIIKEDDLFYNRFIWAAPDGLGRSYDKRHLFGLSGEDQSYTGGSDRFFYEYKGWRIFPQVCYDLRFPVWSRNDLDYDLLLYVANWPSYRTHAWSTLLLARAIENQCFTIGVNRVGIDGLDNPFPGHSAIIDYAGKHLIHLGDGEHAIHAGLNKVDMYAFRKKFAFLKDRDHFKII